MPAFSGLKLTPRRLIRVIDSMREILKVVFGRTTPALLRAAAEKILENRRDQTLCLPTKQKIGSYAIFVTTQQKLRVSKPGLIIGSKKCWPWR